MSVKALKIIDGAMPETTLLAAGFPLYVGDDVVSCRSALAKRDGAVALYVECDDSGLSPQARAGGLGIVVDVDTRNGVDVVDAARIVFSPTSGHVWPANRPLDMVADGALVGWNTPIVVGTLAALSGGTAPIVPHGARPVGADVARLRLSGEITDRSAKSLIHDVERASGQTIVLDVDSEGGTYASARAIFAALAAHTCRVETHAIRADSAAALVFLAGDRRTIDPDATIALHECAYTAIGDDRGTVERLRQMAAALTEANDYLAATIAVRTGTDAAVARDWLAGEVVLSAGDAVRNRFAHGVLADSAPLAPRALRVKTAPINGPYNSVTPALYASRGAILQIGRAYSRGDTVTFRDRTYRAKGNAFGALGALAPDRDAVLWERVR